MATSVLFYCHWGRRQWPNDGVSAGHQFEVRLFYATWKAYFAFGAIPPLVFFLFYVVAGGPIDLTPGILLLVFWLLVSIIAINQIEYQDRERRKAHGTTISLITATIRWQVSPPLDGLLKPLGYRVIKFHYERGTLETADDRFTFFARRIAPGRTLVMICLLSDEQVKLIKATVEGVIRPAIPLER